MKKLGVFLLTMVFMVTMIAGCALAEAPLTVGYIMGGPEAWQQAQMDGAQFACDKVGYEMVVLNTNYTPELEITNAEDLISKGVDAIIMYTVNEESGQRVAQMCNEADIPLFVLDGMIGEGPGKAVTYMSYSFVDLGMTVGKFVSENYPGGKMVYISGLLGAGVVEGYTDGLKQALEAGGNVVELVDQQPADWDRAKAIAVMENMVASGKEFDIAFINNEDMATGGIQVLKENNLLENVRVIATGGSEDGLAMIENGELQMTVAASPAYEGVYMVKVVQDYFAGKAIEPSMVVPATPITKDNVDKAITWVPDDNMFGMIFQ